MFRGLFSLIIVVLSSLLMPASSQVSIFDGFSLACWAVGSDGWTTICSTPGTGTCDNAGTGTNTGTCFTTVSSSTGNDATCTSATTQAAAELLPCASTTKGLSLVRNNKPDHLLFKKGDTWTGAAAVIPELNNKKGLDPSKPILIGAYGTGARPLFETPTATIGIGATGNSTDYIAIIGLEFYSYTRDPANGAYAGPGTGNPTGILFINSYHWLLIEDVKVRYFRVGVSINTESRLPTRMPGFSFRRNVIVDSYDISGDSQGLLLAGALAPIIEENVFDHNGWCNLDPSCQDTNVASVRERNTYINQITDTNSTTYRGNISTRSASDGIQLRTGGVLYNNLFAKNTYGFSIACGTPTSSPVGDAGCVQIAIADVSYNVTTESVDADKGTDATLGRGVGAQINAGAVGSGINIHDNIFMAGSSTSVNATVFQIQAGANNIIGSGNIAFNWHLDVVDSGSGNAVGWAAVDLTGTNTGASPCYGVDPGDCSPPEPFSAPTRSIGSYYGSIGGSPATTDGFIAAARAQSKDSWNSALMACAVNDYIRAGFDVAAQGCPTY